MTSPVFWERYACKARAIPCGALLRRRMVGSTGRSSRTQNLRDPADGELTKSNCTFSARWQRRFHQSIHDRSQGFLFECLSPVRVRQ